MKITKIRHQFLLEEKLSEKLESLSSQPGVTKSDIVAKAIKAFFEKRGTTELDERYAKRLDQQSRDLGKIKSDVEALLESLTLFIRFTITLNANTPMPDRATQAIGYERYTNFIDEVEDRLARGRNPFDLGDDGDAP